MDRNAFFGYFQLAALAVFLLIFLGRGAYLRFGKDINPFAPGVGKRGIRRVVEVGFLDLYAFGTFLINGTLGFLLFALVLAAGVHHQALQKESFLRKAYGTSYHDYCRRTARYFSWKSVWKTDARDERHCCGRRRGGDAIR